MTSRRWLASFLFVPLGVLPDKIKQRLRQSPLLPIYAKVYSFLGNALGAGLYVIESGPLKGRLLFTDPGSFRAYLLGVYEPAVASAIQEFCKHGMTVCDVGAHYGYSALLMAQYVGESGHCIAFEAYSQNYDNITKTATANNLPNLSIEHLAIADLDGRAKFCIHNNTLMGRIDHFVSRKDRKVFSGMEIVGMRTLDSFLLEKGVPGVSFVKIDVEGAERAVLRGARNTILQHRPVLLIEVHAFESPENHAQPLLREIRHLNEILSNVVDQHLIGGEYPWGLREQQGAIRLV